MPALPVRPRPLAYCLLLLGLLAAASPASPASGQWSRVSALPSSTVYSVWSNADTIVAGSDTATYVSTNAGASWKVSTRPTPPVALIDAVWFRNGRLYAGTFGQGVFVSDDLGGTWQPYNEGLTGGILDSQLDLADFEVRGDSLYAATFGAGVYVRGFAAGDTWHHFGENFEPNQASNVNDVALGGTRLLASAGGNGTIFWRDPGNADWTFSLLINGSIAPGLAAQAAVWTGSTWVVGTNAGPYWSVAGQEPWTHPNLGLSGLLNTALATRAGQVFAAFVTSNSAVIETSVDGGASWQTLETLLNVFVFRFTVSGSTLYAARGDGLWTRPLGNVSVPPGEGGDAGAALRFTLAGPQPAADDVRLRFDMPQAGPAAIDVFDVRGRRVGDRIAGSFAAGPHEVAWSARGLAPGVYAARLAVGARHAVVRIVRVR